MAQRKNQRNLVGKLLLSTALVAVSLTYGLWQRQERRANMPIPPISKPPGAYPSARGNSEVTARAELAAQATKAEPDVSSGITAAEPQKKTPMAAKENARAPAPPPLTAMVELRMYQPPPLQSPLPLITGTPTSGASAPIPQGTHLQDGDYFSDTQQFEWGDLQVKILVHDGQITGAQLVQYPDHRAESLQISRMAGPILNSELIQTQQTEVDIVSSATDTSYVYRRAVASAIEKATRP